MKKTLIALLALGSTAMATDTVISNANQTAVLLVNGAIVVENITSTMDGFLTTQDPGDTAYRNSFTYTPANIGKGTGGASYTLSFKITNIVDGATAQGMTIDFFTLNGGGNPQNAENGYNVSVLLTRTGQEGAVYYDEPTILTYKGDNKYSGSAYEGEPAITPVEQASFYKLDLSDVDWEVDTYSMMITFAQDPDHPSGCFGGVGNVTLHASNVPEPATGTLSLLALAGLCARRRKK